MSLMLALNIQLRILHDHQMHSADVHSHLDSMTNHTFRHTDRYTVCRHQTGNVSRLANSHNWPHTTYTKE